MQVSLIYAVSYVVAIVASVILSAYFLREYYNKRLRASVSWGFGFLMFAIGQANHLYSQMFGTVVLGKTVLLVATVLVFTGMVAFYYGTSLLFFRRGSFFREKMSVVLWLILLIFAIYLGLTFETAEQYVEGIADPISLFVFSPIFFIMGILFYRVSGRLGRDDPRRRTILSVAAGWFFAVISSVFIALLGRSLILDTFVHFTRLLAWILILYGMVLGKAARA